MFCVLSCLLAVAVQGQPNNYNCSKPASFSHKNRNNNEHSPPHVLIAHRGASAHLPEHSLEAYRLALELGAHYIEPDLVTTKDGHLIAIHSVDLNITTNVAEVFSADRAVISAYQGNTTGFWAYEFTLDELKTLRLKQRLPNARTTAFDGLFSIPTLTEILELQQDWGTKILPTRFNATSTSTARQQQESYPDFGLYAELKHADWILQDTGVVLADVFFEHLDIHSELWESAVLSRVCTANGGLPPLVLQSFDPKELHYVHDQWTSTYATIPPPPMIVLMTLEQCRNEEYWFELGEQYHSIVAGIGPDKRCLLVDGHEVMQRAAKWDWEVHPWTVRPELEFLVVSPPENDVKEELQRLFCDFRIPGVFTEDVSVARLVSNLPCPSNAKTTVTSPATSSGSSCPSGDLTAFLIPLVIVLMGVIAGLLICMCCRRTSTSSLPKPLRIRKGGSVILPQEEDDSNESHGGNHNIHEEEEEYQVEIT